MFFNALSFCFDFSSIQTAHAQKFEQIKNKLKLSKTAKIKIEINELGKI